MLGGEVFACRPCTAWSSPTSGRGRVRDNSWAGLQERSSDWLLSLGSSLLLSTSRLPGSWCPHRQATRPQHPPHLQLLRGKSWN